MFPSPPLHSQTTHHARHPSVVLTQSGDDVSVGVSTHLADQDLGTLVDVVPRLLAVTRVTGVSSDLHDSLFTSSTSGVSVASRFLHTDGHQQGGGHWKSERARSRDQLLPFED